MSNEEIKPQLSTADENLGKVLFTIDTLPDNEENNFLKKCGKPVISAKLNIEYVLGILGEGGDNE